MKIHTLPVGEIQTNCYLVETKEKNAIVVDPGDEPAKIIHKLEELGLTPKLILLTHGHFDHIGGVEGLLQQYPSIPLYLGEGEMDVVRWSKPYLERLGCPSVAEITEEHAILLKNGANISLDELSFTVLHTPGHTKGGVVYYGEGVMFSGDTLFHEEIGRCDLFTGDYPTMLKTLQVLYKLEGDFIVYPGHEEASTLEHERKHNPYMKLGMEQS